jgi:transposase
LDIFIIIIIFQKKHSLNNIITEIIYVLKTGISWRNLRSSINYNSIYYHFKRFINNNIFIDAYNSILNLYLQKIKKINGIIIDSSFIQNKFGKGNIKRNKFFKNKKCFKLSIITDFNNIPFSILLANGNLHDSTIFNDHKNDILKYKKNISKDSNFLADKGYLSKNINDFCSNNNIFYMVPNKINSKKPPFTDEQNIIYKKRINIEHLFARIKQFRRVALIYDSKTNTYNNFLHLALLIIILEKFPKIC